MYDYFEIILGIILVLLFSIILGLVGGSLGSYLGFLIATILVGYRNQRDLVNGALWGSLCAVLGGMVFLVAMFLMELFGSMGPGASMMEMGVLALIIGLMVDGLIGSVGGALGWLLWSKNF